MNKIAVIISTILLIFISILIYNSYRAKTFDVPIEEVNEELNIPTEVSGWIPWWRQAESITNINNYGENLNEVYFTWAYLNENSGIDFKYANASAQTALNLKSKGIKTSLTISNVLGNDKHGKLPDNDEDMQILINQLFSFVEDYELDGINIDLEYITKVDEEDYEKFVDLVTKEAKAKGLTSSISIPSISGSRYTWVGAEGFDLEYLCSRSESIIIMMYDLHNAKTSFGPLNSYEWMDQVLGYALKRCDKDKLVAGLPLYGYVWNSDGKFVETLNETILNQKYANLEQKRDDSSSEIVANNDKFTLYVSDTESISSKIESIKTYGIHKFAVWHLGNLNEEIDF